MLTENEKKELNKKACKVMKSKKFLKAETAKRFAASETEKIWVDAEKRLYEFYALHTDLPKGVSAHTDSFIFPAAAIYLSLKEEAPDKAFEIMECSMKEKALEGGKSLARMTAIPGFKKFFLKMWDSMSHKMFGETAGFKNIFYDCPKGEFRMDITQCPYNKYLTELGCPELTKLFCDNDIYSYGNLPGLKFTRTKTLGTGDSCCDFKMELVK